MLAFRTLTLITAGLLLVFSVAGPVKAAAVTRTFDFSATGFGPTASVDPLEGSVTVTFDPMGSNVSNETSGFTLNSLNITVDSTVAFSYFPSSDVLAIGGLSLGVGGTSSAQNDFIYLINDASTMTPSTGTVRYCQLGVGMVCGFGDGLASSGVVEVVADAPAYGCIGFEPPLADGPVTVKKNRVLPLKAELVDGDGFVLEDGDLTAPPVVQVIYDSGIFGDPPIDVSADALSAGKGTDGNLFVFSDDSWWQFNLKTKNYSASGTYTISMVSGDGAEYLVVPTCVAQFVIE